ncbi:MAG: hypothetical protein FWF24_01155 [Alphaproteobacteria bacterium]|nr:hypothetical protein [Alphaproteobacteria bacterium]
MNQLLFDSADTQAVSWSFRAALPPSLALSRATGASCVDEQGLIKMLEVNKPRFDFDPVSRKARGLLLESQSTNLVWPSVPGSGYSLQLASLTPAQESAPDGTQAVLFADDFTSGTHDALSASMTDFETGQTYTVSIYVKAQQQTVLQLRLSTTLSSAMYANFDVAQGLVSRVAGGVEAKIEPAGRGWYRCVMIFTAQATVNARTLGLSLTGSNPQAVRMPSYLGTQTGVYIWGAQCEVGSFVSSYIPTTNMIVTRGRDTLATGALSWFNPQQGTFLVDFTDVPAASGTQAFTARFYGDGTSNFIGVTNSGYVGGNVLMQIYSAGALQCQINTNISPAQNVKALVRYKLGDHAVCVNGQEPQVRTTGLLPDPLPNMLAFQGVRMHLRGFQYWRQPLSNNAMKRKSQ